MKLLVTYKLSNNDPSGFFRELSALGIPEVVRKENGCRRYEYFLPADGAADRILLVEEWASAELQALHLEQPHMKRLADIKSRYVAETVVELIAER